MSMTEVEMSRTLGILADPEKNRLPIGEDLRDDIQMLCMTFQEMMDQKEDYGSVNTDLWLEFIPWHSLN